MIKYLLLLITPSLEILGSGGAEFLDRASSSYLIEIDEKANWGYFGKFRQAY